MDSKKLDKKNCYFYWIKLTVNVMLLSTVSLTLYLLLDMFSPLIAIVPLGGLSITTMADSSMQLNQIELTPPILFDSM